ncbi:MAG: PH domain-containing protein [Oscillospiraceae bacterium]
MLRDMFDNLGERKSEKLEKEFGEYLMPGERVKAGFKMVRDAVLFTDKRLIFLDVQGLTGIKVSVESIFLSGIVSVTAETAGFGLDESALILTYFLSPYHRAHEPKLAVKRLEFGKKINIQALYIMLEELAYENYQRINDR